MQAHVFSCLSDSRRLVPPPGDGSRRHVPPPCGGRSLQRQNVSGLYGQPGGCIFLLLHKTAVEASSAKADVINPSIDDLAPGNAWSARGDRSLQRESASGSYGQPDGCIFLQLHKTAVEASSAVTDVLSTGSDDRGPGNVWSATVFLQCQSDVMAAPWMITTVEAFPGGASIY